MQGYRNNPVSEIAVYFGAVLALFFLSCHQVTEFQAADETALTFIRSDDFQVEKVMGGFTGGRLLMSHGSDELILVTSEGMLYRIDVSNFAVDTSFVIGGSSGTGYGDGAFAMSGELYVLGPGSQVIEVDLSTSQVVDKFNPAQEPVALAASSIHPRLYVADRASQQVVEVRTFNNSIGFDSDLDFPPSELFLEPFTDRYLMIGGSDASGTISDIWLFLVTYDNEILQMKSPISDMVPLLEDSIYAVCCPNWSAGAGFIHLIRNYAIPDTVCSRSVQGHPVEMCFNHSSGYSGYLSVLGKTDGGNSVVTVMGFPGNYLDPQVESEIQLDGYPRDIASPGQGEYIVVLTSD